jgi:Protein of unknown function (DUF4242)
VGKYLVEFYLPSTGLDEFASTAARARTAAEEVVDRGTPVRYLRSIFVPGDELCFLLYEGSSKEAVGEAVHRAAITFDRIVDARDDER